MDQKIINLYDRFTHGGMSRRDFLDRLTELAGSAAAAVALLPLLQNDYAQAAIVRRQRSAPDRRARLLRFAQGQDQRLPGARARPAASGRSSWSSTRTAGSIRISRTSRAVSRSKAISPMRSICCRWSAARPANEDAARDLHPKTEPGRCRGRAGLRGVVPQEASGIDRQGRRGRLLLRRPDGQPSRGRKPRARRRRRLLRTAGAGRSGAQRSRPRCCCTMRRRTTA